MFRIKVRVRIRVGLGLRLGLGLKKKYICRLLGLKKKKNISLIPKGTRPRDHPPIPSLPVGLEPLKHITLVEFDALTHIKVVNRPKQDSGGHLRALIVKRLGVPLWINVAITPFGETGLYVHYPLHRLWLHSTYLINKMYEGTYKIKHPILSYILTQN